MTLKCYNSGKTIFVVVFKSLTVPPVNVSVCGLLFLAGISMHFQPANTKTYAEFYSTVMK